jgi:hypothetical protein
VAECLINRRIVRYGERYDLRVNTDEHGLQQEAVETLGFITAAVQYQADIVRFALGVGIPKQQIHQLTGLARTTINRIASEAGTCAHPCDCCVREHYQDLRREGSPCPVRESSGYLLYRIGNQPEIVAQKLCAEHRRRDWARELPASARLAWCPHNRETPSRVVYSLGGIRDDSEAFRDYFGDFPEWATTISFLLAPGRQEYSSSGRI